MDIWTHREINHALCGKPLQVEENMSKVSLETTDAMTVDPSGLIHGGFVFGLADHAAMIAVNHPNVVLGAADVKFLKPVRSGETVVATATVSSTDGKKKIVEVEASVEDTPVFSGLFVCFVLLKHILTPA
jgi:uncharacterized protein (TIGR00369 family)